MYKCVWLAQSALADEWTKLSTFYIDANAKSRIQIFKLELHENDRNDNLINLYLQLAVVILQPL